jgi:metal-dependent amidase/aminoacylase/carboxypeptidase family protein
MSTQEQILQAIDAAAERLIEVSRQIHDAPELRFEERFAAKLLTETLASFGLTPEQPVGGLDTAFRAEFGRRQTPKMAILAEYDALPNGHACGHNLIAGAALGAVVGLGAVRDQLPGGVVILGTPAEEGGGGKVILLEQGAFADIDAAIRAFQADYLQQVTARVLQCAEAAALATGTRVETEVRRGYRDMRDNMTMARRFGEHLQSLGVEVRERDPEAGFGSTDMGDVSYAMPAIHPYLGICDIGEAMCHQDAFVQHADSPRGYQAMLQAAKAMALTTYDLLT